MCYVFVTQNMTFVGPSKPLKKEINSLTKDLNKEEKDLVENSNIQDKIENNTNNEIELLNNKNSNEIVSLKRSSSSPTKPLKRIKNDIIETSLNHLPSANLYEWSYMHKAIITFTLCTKQNYILTSSFDGHVKFWHKTVENIEFVKDFIVSELPITHLSCSYDGKWAIALSGNTISVFDVINFDLVNCILLDFESKMACLFYSLVEKQWLVAVAKEKQILIYKLEDTNEIAKPIHTLNLHLSNITCLESNYHYNCIISTDIKGMIEIWDVNTFKFPEVLTSHDGTKTNKQLYKFKSSTDLYEFAKKKTYVRSIAFSSLGDKFVTESKDRFIRVFDFFTGKLLNYFDETLEEANRIQQDKSLNNSIFHLEDFDFGKRLSVEKAIENDPYSPKSNALFDKTGQIIIYPSLWGIKFIDLQTNKIVRLIGKAENTERFLSISIFQGVVDVARVHLANIEKKRALNPNDPLLPRRSTNISGEALLNSMNNDPMIFAAAYSRERFYIFSRREPGELSSENPTLSRDIFNERPKQDEIVSSIRIKKLQNIETIGIIHTSKGDIHFKLFPLHAPKAVENFVQHSKSGYYNGCIFHRVIKDFMIQTGDPTGTGSGGESIWGTEFEDEFSNELNFDKPFQIAMANAGRDSNGSQFFITVQPTMWLNGKHTIFGEVTKGFDTVHIIENSVVHEVGIMQHKPIDEIKIVSISITSK